MYLLLYWSKHWLYIAHWQYSGCSPKPTNAGRVCPCTNIFSAPKFDMLESCWAMATIVTQSSKIWNKLKVIQLHQAPDALNIFMQETARLHAVNEPHISHSDYVGYRWVYIFYTVRNRVLLNTPWISWLLRRCCMTLWSVIGCYLAPLKV